MKKEELRWKKNWTLFHYFFKKNEIQTIKEKLKNMKTRVIAFCSFENRFAKCGGLAAVTIKILPWLRKLKGVEKALLFTPYYPFIMKPDAIARLENTGKIAEVDFDNQKFNVEIYRYIPTDAHTGHPLDGVEEYFLKAGGFFDAKNKLNDPYIYDEENKDRNNTILRDNGLFFSKAVPLVLEALGTREDIVFHLQEWQTALIALTSKEAMVSGRLISCGAVQTMHNPFDAALPPDVLEKVLDDNSLKKHNLRETAGFLEEFYDKSPSVYQVGLRLVDGPITTVSRHFAGELTGELMQTSYFAPHMQHIFKKNAVYGVNNGMFVDYPEEYKDKTVFSSDEIKRIKNEKRSELLGILDSLSTDEGFGLLTYNNGSIKNLPGNVPILLMSGRLDFNQKGYDIFLRALRNFGEDEIKAILTPMPTKDSDLDFLREVAMECPGNVTVCPKRMEPKAYLTLQMGVTYGIMPSIYEPFGAAVEYMVNGTVTIARDTGGLRGQVVHGKNGFLFKEDPACYTPGGIKTFMDAGDDIHKRDGNAWSDGMVDAFTRALKEAADFYRHQPNKYYLMIINSLEMAKTFDWQKNAKEYFEVFKTVKDV